MRYWPGAWTTSCQLHSLCLLSLVDNLLCRAKRGQVCLNKILQMSDAANFSLLSGYLLTLSDMASDILILHTPHTHTSSPNLWHSEWSDLHALLPGIPAYKCRWLISKHTYLFIYCIFLKKIPRCYQTPQAWPRQEIFCCVDKSKVLWHDIISWEQREKNPIFSIAVSVNDLLLPTGNYQPSQSPTNPRANIYSSIIFTDCSFR